MGQFLERAEQGPLLFAFGIAEPNDDQIPLRCDHDVLTAKPVAAEYATAIGRDPEVGPIFASRVSGGCPRIVDPALGQNSFTFPAAVSQAEQAESSEVLGGAGRKRRGDPCALWVELRREAADAKGVEKALAQGRDEGFAAESNGVLAEPGNDVRGSAGIVPLGSGGGDQWFGGGVVGDVCFARAEQHFDGIRLPRIFVDLVELQAAAHSK